MGTDNIEQRRKAENKAKRQRAKDARKANTQKKKKKTSVLTDIA